MVGEDWKSMVPVEKARRRLNQDHLKSKKNWWCDAKKSQHSIDSSSPCHNCPTRNDLVCH
ncbi:MAG: hypothetical protein ACYTBZ_07470 [Planctomycetota bacterium]|jgi:hypothetical protein